MTNQLQTLATAHAALVLELTHLAQKFVDALALSEALGHQINAALASSDGATYTTLDEWAADNLAPTFDRGPEPVAEMAAHVPSTVPPPVETNEIGAIVHSAGFAPDHEPPDVGKPGRKKTEYTAREWAYSTNFLALMKKQAPFKDWPAEQQNAKRDEFVASVPEGEKMNRWGQRFAKFCGVST